MCVFLSKNSPIKLKLISMIKSNAFWNSLSKNRPTLVLKIWNFTTQLTLLHSVAPFMFQNCTKMSHKQCTLCYAYYVGNDNHGKNRSESHTYSRILTKFPNPYPSWRKDKKSKRSVFKFYYKNKTMEQKCCQNS